MTTNPGLATRRLLMYVNGTLAGGFLGIALLSLVIIIIGVIAPERRDPHHGDMYALTGLSVCMPIGMAFGIAAAGWRRGASWRTYGQILPVIVVTAFYIGGGRLIFAVMGLFASLLSPIRH